MIGTLAELLALVRSDLAEAGVDAADIEAVLRLAAALPPITPTGLECRLGPEGATLALQQGVLPNGDDLMLLAAHIEQATARSVLPRHPGWERALALCDAWHGEMRHAISEVWLEHDLDAAEPLIPSIFVGLPRSGASDNETTAVWALRHFLAGMDLATLEANVRRCFAACPAGAHVSHIGFMLSRPVRVVRVNVGMLRPEQIAPFLRTLDWQDTTAELDALLRDLFDLVDRVRLCLDIGERILPQIGLECSFVEGAVLHRRWPALLDLLVQRQLCTPEQRAGLLAWPGRTSPLTAAAPWPAHLLIASLRRPASELGLVERRISHLKLTHRPEQLLEAKAYLGFDHVWSHAAHEQPAVVPEIEPDVRPAPFIDRERLAAPIAVATAYLESQSTQGGWWLDFDALPDGPSDEWVSAYVGSVLMATPAASARKAARRAWQRLVGRATRVEGWGFNRFSGPDSDTTGWCLKLADAVGTAETERVARARRFMAEHICADGGIATYAAEQGATSDPREDLGGWGLSHPCVSAAVALLAEYRAPLLPYLRATQRPDGSWPAYWWDDDEYTTAFAAVALHRAGVPEDRPRWERATAWAAGRLGKTGCVVSEASSAESAFATALVAYMLGSIGDAEVSRAVSWLLDHQRPDGSWEATARLLVPPRSAMRPGENRIGTPVFLDQQRIFTTATALMALLAVTERLTGSQALP